MIQEPQAPQSAPDRQLEKRQTLWILLALYFVAGWFGAIITPQSDYFPLYQLGFGIVSTLFVVRWVALDALQRRFPLTTTWIFFFVLFSLFVVPVYLFKTRGPNSWRPILRALGLFVIFVVAASLGGGIASVLGLGTPATATK